MTSKIKKPGLFYSGILLLLIWLALLILGRDWVSQLNPTLVLLSPILLVAGLFLLYMSQK